MRYWVRAILAGTEGGRDSCFKLIKSPPGPRRVDFWGAQEVCAALGAHLPTTSQPRMGRGGLLDLVAATYLARDFFLGAYRWVTSCLSCCSRCWWLVPVASS